MARSRKKSASQGLIHVVTAGLPPPVRDLLRSRLGMPMLLVLLAGGLVGSGILTVQWTNGKPSVAIDRERAAEVKQAVQTRVASAPAGQPQSGNVPSVQDVLRRLANQDASPTVPGAGTSSASTGSADVPAGTSSSPMLGGQIDPQARPPVPPASPYQPTVRIATFNIQVFGVSKMEKPHVMQVLADVVRRFDVVAIQEIRSVDDTVMPRFVALINSAGAQYDFIIGPRLGRTNSKEQYAFVFDTTRIEFDPRSIYTVADPQDLLHREPLATRFRARGVPPNQAFTFTLVNIHTDPDETSTELDALAQVFVGVQQNGTGEDDVILLGDLNVDERRLGDLGRLPGIGWVVSGMPTNTRGDKTYDNIVFDRRTTVEFTGRWGVLNLMQEYSLTVAQALEVSDHLPVWAEFSVYEGLAGPLALQPGSVPR
jgi:endonuclease/exonuclease/phosphatase family metal-dependent hydrolase